MWIVKLALRRPFTFLVMAVLIGVLALSIVSMPNDIFPYIDIPVLRVIWSYNGMEPDETCTDHHGSLRLPAAPLSATPQRTRTSLPQAQVARKPGLAASISECVADCSPCNRDRIMFFFLPVPHKVVYCDSASYSFESSIRKGRKQKWRNHS